MLKKLQDYYIKEFSYLKIFNSTKTLNIYDFYQTISIDKELDQEKFLEKLNSNNFRYLIEGSFGSGKTTFLKYLAYRWAKLEILQEYDLVIYINLEKIKSPKTINDIVKSNYEPLLSNMDIGNQKILYLFDGFDKIETKQYQDEFLHIAQFFDNVIITSRNDTVNFNKFTFDKINTLNGFQENIFNHNIFKKYDDTIKSFQDTNNGVVHYLKSIYENIDNKILYDILFHITKIDDLKEIIQNPLFMKIIIDIALETSLKGKINKYIIYLKIIEYIIFDINILDKYYFILQSFIRKDLLEENEKKLIQYIANQMKHLRANEDSIYKLEQLDRKTIIMLLHSDLLEQNKDKGDSIYQFINKHLKEYFIVYEFYLISELFKIDDFIDTISSSDSNEQSNIYAFLYHVSKTYYHNTNNSLEQVLKDFENKIQKLPIEEQINMLFELEIPFRTETTKLAFQEKATNLILSIDDAKKRVRLSRKIKTITNDFEQQKEQYNGKQ